MSPSSRRLAGSVALGGARRAARALTHARSDHAWQVDRAKTRPRRRASPTARAAQGCRPTSAGWRSRRTPPCRGSEEGRRRPSSRRSCHRTSRPSACPRLGSTCPASHAAALTYPLGWQDFPSDARTTGATVADRRVPRAPTAAARTHRHRHRLRQLARHHCHLRHPPLDSSPRRPTPTYRITRHTTRRPPSHRRALALDPCRRRCGTAPQRAHAQHARVHAHPHHPTAQTHPNPHSARAELTRCALCAARQAEHVGDADYDAPCRAPHHHLRHRRPRHRRPPAARRPPHPSLVAPRHRALD